MTGRRSPWAVKTVDPSVVERLVAIHEPHPDAIDQVVDIISDPQRCCATGAGHLLDAARGAARGANLASGWFRRSPTPLWGAEVAPGLHGEEETAENEVLPVRQDQLALRRGLLTLA